MLAAAWLLAGGLAQAQTSSYYSGTTTSGMFGSNQLGGSASSRANTGNAGSMTRQGATAGTGGVGGQGATNVAQTARSMAPAVTLSQQPGAFVGADTADTGNLRSRQTGAQNRNMSGLGQLQNLFTQSQQQINSQNSQSTGSGTQPQIRIALKLGFQPQPVSAARFQAFGTRITQLPGIQWAGPAQVSLEGRTAVLRGKVATEEDRQLVEDLARMEPDVLDVRNELVVDSSETTGEELPPAPPSAVRGER
jgi:hypothetical protein